jgi:hypothetical protein
VPGWQSPDQTASSTAELTDSTPDNFVLTAFWGNGDSQQMDVSSESIWESVASFLDIEMAHTVAALLEAEVIPAQVIAGSKLMGEAPLWEVRVPADHLDAARCLLAQSQLSDPELTYLATGVLGTPDEAK